MHFRMFVRYLQIKQGSFRVRIQLRLGAESATSRTVEVESTTEGAGTATHSGGVTGRHFQPAPSALLAFVFVNSCCNSPAPICAIGEIYGCVFFALFEFYRGSRGCGWAALCSLWLKRMDALRFVSWHGYMSVDGGLRKDDYPTRPAR